MNENHNRDLSSTSKFISLILRHKPEVIGITLDEHGWADVEELIAGIRKTRTFDMEMLEEIVRTDSKMRYHSRRCCSQQWLRRCFHFQPYFPRRMCSPSGFRKRLLRMLWMCCSEKLPKCPTRTMCCFPLMRCCRRPSVTSLLQEKVQPIFSAFFRFFLSFDIPFLKKKPLPYGSSPFSFFAANYCTYLFSSAFTICWNSSFA